DLDELKRHAESPDAKPDLKKAYIRYRLDALAAGITSDGKAGKRLTGGNPRDPAVVGAFLTDWSKKLQADGFKDIATAVTELGVVWGSGPTRDLGPLFVKAVGDSPEAPAIRLILAQRLLDVIAEAAESPENERGKTITKLIPGFPSPMTQDLKATVFPAAMRLLALLLNKGAGAETGLAPHYKKLAETASKTLENRAIPLSVPIGAGIRAGTPIAGVTGGYQPLGVVSIIKDVMRVGARPTFAWKDGKVVDLAQSPGWPGNVLAGIKDLTKPEGEKELLEKTNAALSSLEKRLAPIETAAYSDRYPEKTAVLNADRGERGRSILVAIDDAVDSKAMARMLALVTQSGFTDLRIVQPGQPGVVLPVFFKRIPKVPEVKPPAGRRPLLVLTGNSAEIYPPAKKGGWKLSSRGWPDGTRVVNDRKRFFKLVVPWTKEMGFQSAVKASLTLMCEKVRCGPVVNVVVRTRDTPAMVVVDACAEIEAVEGPAFEGLATYFPGAACSEGGSCPAKIPVLFASTRVPKPAKAEVEVKETRQAGFCEKGAVARVMRGRSGAYRACYEMQLQRHPELSGRIQIRFTIEPNGSVSGVKTIRNELNAKVASCIVKQVSTLKFPKPDGGVCVIRWPFKFKPGG
ncbi:MAG: AgmX/PglI C-terminal domain-containing protein, partial [Deltaproteobacteria bacterium]|nr:AgmX/PglI C-terminal domain-containing protein [Deltaproteobacteria bacterium]